MINKFTFIVFRKTAYICSAVIAAIFLIGTGYHGGFNKGIDFIGGTSVLVKFDKPVGGDGEYSIPALREVLGPIGLGQNIRTVGAAGASDEEAREVSIDVRGSDWVDQQVQAFIGGRAAAGGSWTADDVAARFSGVLQPGALNALVANFRAQSSETGATALYDPSRIAQQDLTDVFQSIFNENISLSVQGALLAAFQPVGGAKEIDLNNVGGADNLAASLAELKVKALAGHIASFGAETSARPWSSVEEFLASTQTTVFRSPRIMSRLYTETAPRASAISVLTGDPEELAAVFRDAFTARFRGVAGIITEHRDKDFGGILPTVRDAISFVPDADLETRSLLEKHAHAGRFILASSETVGPSVGKDLQSAAIKAILVSLVCIVLYVWMRFELRYGIGAIVALIHDSLLTILFIGFCNMEFSIPIVAAVLTVIGYSINDTIVVYDRIREKLGKLRGSPDPALIDIAINETIPRTIGTSVTTLMASIAFLFLGPVVTRDLSITLTFGIIIGTYSSIFVAAPILVEWDRFVKSQSGPKSTPPPASISSPSGKGPITSSPRRKRKGFPSKKKK